MSDVEGADGGIGAVLDPSGLSADEQIALSVIEEICEAAGGLRAVARASQPPYLSVDLVGEDAREIWGRSGAALDALQSLANTIISRRVEREVRVSLDADEYRARRAEMLRQRALDIAREVKELNQEAVLESLSAQDRRIIHQALSEDGGVQTYSEGMDADRRLIIAPR